MQLSTGLKSRHLLSSAQTQLGLEFPVIDMRKSELALAVFPEHNQVLDVMTGTSVCNKGIVSLLYRLFLFTASMLLMTG